MGWADVTQLFYNAMIFSDAAWNIFALPLLIATPAMLEKVMLSFAYGRVLMVQKTFANGARYPLSYDIASRQALRDAKRI